MIVYYEQLQSDLYHSLEVRNKLNLINIPIIPG